MPVDEVGKERRIMKFGEFYEMARTKTLYAKGWHLDQIDSLSSLYSVPLPFQDDWLNWYWQELFPNSEVTGCPEDDYSFCYVGSKDTKTALHHDVILSYSWSVNPAVTKYGRFGGLEGNSSESAAISVRQSPGDAIFVPSGWYHSVENEVDSATGFTVSINRNWFNGFQSVKGVELSIEGT